METKNCALFDLDGVIIDSEGTYTKFWQSIEELYPTGIENFAVAIKGTTLTEILKYYPQESTRTDICNRLAKFQNEMTYPLFPGVENFLAELRNRNIPAALVTSSDSKKMDALFRQRPQLRNYFSVIIDASKVTRSKPDPEGYLLGAKLLGVEPQNAYIFEDSRQGLQAGVNAGAKAVIGLATTLPAETVRQAGATIVLNSWTDFSVDKMLSL